MSIYNDNKYKATILRHVDGDSTEVRVHLPFRLHADFRIRWYGINADERFTVLGKLATAAVNQQLPVGSKHILQSRLDVTGNEETEKYGGYLGIFWKVDMVESVNQWMLDNKHAVEYYGGTRTLVRR